MWEVDDLEIEEPVVVSRLAIVPVKKRYTLSLGKHQHVPNYSVSKSNPERNAIIDAADSMRTRVSTALIRTVEVVKDGISLKMLEDKLQQVDLNGVLQVLDLDKRFQAAAKGAGLEPNETSFLEAIKDTWAAGARAELDSLNTVPVRKSNPCHVPSGPKGGQFCETGGGKFEGWRKLKDGTRILDISETRSLSKGPESPYILTDEMEGRLLVVHGSKDDSGSFHVVWMDTPGEPGSVGPKVVRETLTAIARAEGAHSVGGLRVSGMRSESAETTVPLHKIATEELEFVSKASNTIGLALAFDLLNPETIAWLSTYVMYLIQQVSDETRRAIADVVMNAFQYGGHPYEQARTIRNMIGLTQSQSQAVANFRRMLENEPLAALTRDLRDHRFDATLQQVGRMKGQLSKEQIDKMAQRYYERYLKYRAEAIARTETIRAARMGQEATWRQAIAQGLLPQGLKRKWVVAYDERLCKLCRSIPKLNPDGRGMDEQFVYAAGKAMGTTDGPPLHVHCRCAIVRKVDWNA